MKELGMVGAVVAAYDALSLPEATHAQEERRTDAAINSLISVTKRGELKWLFAPPRSNFYALGHVAIAQSGDGHHLILEQVSDTLGKHFDEDGDERFDHSLTILDADGKEVFFCTDQGHGWSMTGVKLDSLSAKEKALHRSYRVSDLYKLVVGDQRRDK